jgi:hypothetical protein
MARRVSLVGLLALVVLGCGGSARVAALRTNYPYVKDAVVQFVPLAGHKLRVITVGGGLQVVLYGLSDNNERPGPGQGGVFAQFSELGASGGDDHLFLLRVGAALAFERDAARHWLIPYYGFALGAMHESGSRGFAEASLGAYLLHSQCGVVSVDGGYLLPFSEIEELSGIRAQLNVTLIPW